MKRMQTYKLILCIAAMIFIAKPFLGFNLYEQLQNNSQENSLIVKIFTQRKPEFLEEAITQNIAFQALIKEKGHQFILTINALLIALFPLSAFFVLTRRRKCDPGCPPLHRIDSIYLLTRTLTI
ncbi:hypothetical protein KHS38_13225 [Mucilaginibacter sp. Bleaf8]|uniref:hypothetical protein n=1 Tax=Mucilaginibacter sp. Bleaf8 TaxID=2834430 RepID=UPI001BD1AB87|nr:hypothetical protein [Mucilaginibacter sp. Bleaf8]MBS7565367.1 hypothetical protein [Mucilaginibacter sp. Bleaf8]